MSKRVYVVDDDKLYRTVLENIYAVAGYEVCVFANGEDCLRETLIPDLLVIDYYLNSENQDAINGIETIKRIRERLAGLPVIVLSGRADLTTTSRSIELRHLLEDRDKIGLTEEFKDGAFFYLMKDNKTKSALIELSRNLLS